MPWTCHQCHRLREKPESRLPSGWKRREEDVFCDACWREQYVLRAVTIPVVSPVDLPWPQLREALKGMWRTTTQASNWMMTELYARDVRRGTETKMPPMAQAYLYPEARKRFPDLPSQSIAALEQQVKAKYRAKRYEVIWTCQSSLPTFRYPTPFPVPNQGWSVSVEQDVPVVSVRVADQRIQLRLKGGARYRRQLAAVRHMAAGVAVTGQMDIYQRGDDLLCKMVAWLPRPAVAQERTGTLLVRTDVDAMLVALNMKDERLWVYHGDQIPRWSAEHREQLQRWADDSKAEHRPVVPFTLRREESAQRYHHRMHSACHQMAAMIVGYAVRRRFSEVRYDDLERAFCAEFPWYQLAQLIEEKCHAAALSFVSASSEGKEKEAGLLAMA